MRSLFEEFIHLWPATRTDSIRLLLKDFFVLRLPSDLHLLHKTPKEKTFIVIDKEYQDINPLQFLQAGFEHVLSCDREDFVSELFSSCLMSLRPDNFSSNPIPFFFSGFVPANNHPIYNTNLVTSLNSNEDKPFVITELDQFLSQEPALKGVKDLCLLAADEILSNALYNAPVGPAGNRLFVNSKRSERVTLPEGKKIKAFACYSPTKVVIGCEDPFGSVERGLVLNRLSQIYNQDDVSPLTQSQSAGLGLKFVLENCANFYMYCEKRRKTLVACTFLLQGKRKNTSSLKHLHISIR